MDQCHGQKESAVIVRVVSRQLDKVRVEQNHCHGLQMVNASYKGRGARHQLGSIYNQERFYYRTMNTTYSCPSLIATFAIDFFSQFPSIVVTHGCNRCLEHLWAGHEEVCAVRRREI